MEIISYLFSPIPGVAFSYSTELTIYCAALFGFGLLIKLILILSKSNKALQKTLRSVPAAFIWISVITYVLNISRIKGVPYLSMRFLLFIAVSISVYFILKTIYKMLRKYPEYKKVVHTKKKEKKETQYSTKK